MLQTTLDLLEGGYDVHVIADGVSSCNPEEIPIALERMRQAGAQITTSESIAFQLQSRPSATCAGQLKSELRLTLPCIGDASLPTFKPFSSLIKEEKNATRDSLQKLLPSHTKRSML